MASLGLKIYYLRTREKQINQTQLAEALGVRQGTISHIENDVASPHWSLLVDLCRFFDVTPTFLADEDRGVVPLATERWGLRNALVTIGMSVELSKQAVRELEDSRVMCRIEPGGAFYDEEAAAVRQQLGASAADARKALRERQAGVEQLLEAQLLGEREANRKKRRGL